MKNKKMKYAVGAFAVLGFAMGCGTASEMALNPGGAAFTAISAGQLDGTWTLLAANCVQGEQVVRNVFNPMMQGSLVAMISSNLGGPYGGYQNGYNPYNSYNPYNPYQQPQTYQNQYPGGYQNGYNPQQQQMAPTSTLTLSGNCGTYSFALQGSQVAIRPITAASCAFNLLNQPDTYSVDYRPGSMGTTPQYGSVPQYQNGYPPQQYPQPYQPQYNNTTPNTQQSTMATLRLRSLSSNSCSSYAPGAIMSLTFAR